MCCRACCTDTLLCSVSLTPTTCWWRQTHLQPNTGKKKMMAEQRKQQIQRDNQILLLKMNRILTSKVRLALPRGVVRSRA